MRTITVRFRASARSRSRSGYTEKTWRIGRISWFLTWVASNRIWPRVNNPWTLNRSCAFSFLFLSFITPERNTKQHLCYSTYLNKSNLWAVLRKYLTFDCSFLHDFHTFNILVLGGNGLSILLQFSTMTYCDELLFVLTIFFSIATITSLTVVFKLRFCISCSPPSKWIVTQFLNYNLGQVATPRWTCEFWINKL